MKNPYFRLFLISVNVILWSVIIIGSLRYLGNQQSYTHYNHSILKEKPLLLFKTTDDESLTQSIEISTKNENIIPIINIAYRGDYWHVVQVLSKNPYKSISLGSVDDFLNKYQGLKLGINVVNKQLNKFNLLQASLDKKSHLQILFTSETTAVLLEARRKEPKWLFMSSHSLISKFQLMGALFLETITQINEDLVYLTSADELSPRLQKEIFKRKKRVVLEVNSNSKITSSDTTFDFISSDLQFLLAL